MPCDSFVALSPVTGKGCIVFGKNSDRPSSEVQEVVYVGSAVNPKGSKLQCTYIEIEQAEKCHAVILSKPCWMWGAEMGANEHGLCIGNGSVWTKAQGPEDLKKQLLGMDLVRLGLERAASCREAIAVITQVLETHGQGGECFVDPSRQGITYHNSFLIADSREAWVLETVAKHWAAQKCKGGFRNISNELSIGADIDLMSAGLKEYAKEHGWWDGNTEFSFKDVFAKDPGFYSGKFQPCKRYASGLALLKEKSAKGDFCVESMMSILRNEESGICQTGSGKLGSVSLGSQISVLYPPESGKPSSHWFTATPNPMCSAFKPFLFVPGVKGSALTECKSPNTNTHPLYEAHSRIKPLPGNDVIVQVRDVLRDIESLCVKDVEEFTQNYDDSKIDELKDLFNDSVESEMKFYNI